MTRARTVLPVIFLLLFALVGSGQEIQLDPDPLFQTDSILQIKWTYSNKELKKETNDSTFLNIALNYLSPVGTWEELNVRLRKRGNFRLNKCYYAPVKLKIKKKEAAQTLFDGHKNFKVVLPCLQERDKDDNVVKEYMAYKIYELLSPYHFKTRLLKIEYEEERNNKVKVHYLKGILVEDDKHIAKRIGGNVYKRKVHPLQQEAVSCTRDAMFQFMIGNTDFSEAYRHNVKLFFVNGEYVPIPFDFDMSGLVNASYSVVSQIQGKELPISTVRDRYFRGFERDPRVFEEIRKEFLSKKQEIMDLIASLEIYFENSFEYVEARQYIQEFYNLITDEKKFQREIIDRARTE